MLVQSFQFPLSLSHLTNIGLPTFLLDPIVPAEKISEHIKTDRTVFPRIARFAPSVLVKLVGEKPEFFIPAVESDLATFGRIVDKLPDWAIIQISIRVPDLWVAVANVDVSYLVRLAQRRILFNQLMAMGARHEINLDFLVVCLINVQFFNLVSGIPDFIIILRECNVIYWELFEKIKYDQQMKLIPLIPLLKICSYDKPIDCSHSNTIKKPSEEKTIDSHSNSKNDIAMLNKKVEELIKIINANSKIVEDKHVLTEEKPIDNLVHIEQKPIDNLIHVEEKQIDNLIHVEEKQINNLIHVEEKQIDELTKLQTRVNEMDSKMDMILALLSKK